MPLQLVQKFLSQDGSEKEKAAEMLSEADQARDARKWSEAAELYAGYLKLRRADAPIWVQYGHALKESGKLDEAERAYQESLLLSPEIADTHLQLGHLRKRKRNYSGAVAAYREALRIDRNFLDARRELSALGIDPNVDPKTKALIKSLRTPCLVIDLSDVFFYLDHHKTVSGIQRVQLGIAKAIISGGAGADHNSIFVAEGDGRRGYVVLEEVFLNELCKELMKETVEHSRLKDLMRSAKGLGRVYDPVAADTFLMLGAFWVLECVAERIISLKRSGVYLGVLIHDIIPITYPEFCEKSLTDEFKSYFFSAISIADFVLTVSDHSGQAVRNFMALNNISETPVRTLRSAHKTWEAPEGNVAVSADVDQLTKEDYVLYVSTIEIRKNHTYLFRIWKRLVEQRGANNVPRLVFVGRPGWRVKDLMDQLTSTENLNGKIKILHDLSDNELATLYRSAMFTVFPSLEEGWGLPVGESLIFGRPCLASNTSSVPEVGGDFVDYIDPFNINDGYEKVARFIDDKSYRESREAKIKANFVARNWTDVAGDMLETVRAVVTGLGGSTRRVEPPHIKPGRRYKFGHGEDVSSFIETGDARVVHFAFDTQWYPVENFGRWMRAPKGRVEFLIEPSADNAILLLLEVKTTPWVKSTGLSISINETNYSIPRLKPDSTPLYLFEVFCPDGKLALEFAPLGKVETGPDARKELFFGLCSVSYAQRTDVASRLSILEELVLSSRNGDKLKPDPV